MTGTDTTAVPDDTPLSLMRMALALLDRDGEGTEATACHLQMAIDTRTAAKSSQIDQKIGNEALKLPVDPTSLRIGV